VVSRLFWFSQGTPEDPGLMPQALDTLFSTIGQRISDTVPVKPSGEQSFCFGSEKMWIPLGVPFSGLISGFAGKPGSGLNKYRCIESKYWKTVFPIQIGSGLGNGSDPDPGGQIVIKIEKNKKFHVLKNFLQGWKLFLELGRPVLILLEILSSGLFLKLFLNNNLGVYLDSEKCHFLIQ
jgi:hypothetical protein